MSIEQSRKKTSAGALVATKNGVLGFGVPFAIAMLLFDHANVSTPKLVMLVLVALALGGVYGITTWYVKERRHPKPPQKGGT